MHSLAHSLAAVAVLTCSASAGQIIHSAPFGPVGIGATTVVSLPQFDGSAGVLRSIHVTVSGMVSGVWRMENTNPHRTTVGGYSSGQGVGAYVLAQVPGGTMSPPNPAYIPEVVPLSAFDGTTDFAGTSGVSVAFSDQKGDGAPTIATAIYQDSGVALYAGTGTISLLLGPMIQFGPTSLPPGIVHDATVSVSGVVHLVYQYDPLPTGICWATVFSGCPCANPTPPGYGCPNSVDSQGGRLAITGSASLSADTLVLGGSHMPDSFVMYVQGDSFAYAQLPYGDGLRCVTGSLVRLGAHANTGGSSQYPSAGDLPVSVRGGVLAPGTRYYQALYRDNASFCTSSTFNATNGMAILWTP